MKNNVLSIIPYYGGKARMANMIAEMLDYKTTDIYIEPFGGGGRTLLNKPPHKIEYYNDSSAGLCAIFELLSSKETGNKFIDKLYETTEYTEDCFEKSVKLRNQFEDNHLQELLRQMKQLIAKIKEKGIPVKEKEFKRVIKLDGGYSLNYQELFWIAKDTYLEGIDSDKELIEMYQGALEVIQEEFRKKFGIVIKDDNKEEKEKEKRDEQNRRATERIYEVCNIETEVDTLLQEIRYILEKNNITYDEDKVKENKKFIAFIKALCTQRFKEEFNNIAFNTRDREIDKMDLAIATYVVYQMSRDGMGMYYSHQKYKSDIEYKEGINKLYKIMDRLEGVHVTQIDAFMFFNGKNNDCYQYLEDETVMMYCDPTYLKEEDDCEETIKNLEDGINQVIKLRKEYNPGSIYKHYWTRDMHESFLKKIQSAKCKILVSNYRDKERLYDKYLNIKNGWNSIEVETKTTITNGEARNRTEVLWYNY